MIKVLITGLAGFIGENLQNYIEKRYPNWKVYGVDKKTNETKRTFKFDIVKNQKELKNVLLKIKPKYVFHLAGTTGGDDFEKLYRLNVLTTYILLKTIREINDISPRIVIPSSASEYGEIPLLKMPIKENCPLNPVSLYGFSKMMQSELSLLFNRIGLDIVIARIFNIAGPAVPISFSLGKFAYELALIKGNKKKRIIYTKNLDSHRDFLDIRDVCNCLVKLALYGKRGEIYNICRGRPYLLRDLLNRLIEISGVKNIKIIERKKANHKDINISFGSITKLKRVVKPFKPIPIKKILKDTYSYYLSKV